MQDEGCRGERSHVKSAVPLPGTETWVTLWICSRAWKHLNKSLTCLFAQQLHMLMNDCVELGAVRPSLGHLFLPIINIKGSWMDFVFWAAAIRDSSTHPLPPHCSSQLQPQRWRGCRGIDISDASHISSDVLLWSMMRFPSYSAVCSVCHPWDRSVLLHLRRAQAGALTLAEVEINGEWRHWLLILCSILMDEHCSTPNAQQ